jgi:hypothetical protein
MIQTYIHIYIYTVYIYIYAVHIHRHRDIDIDIYNYIYIATYNARYLTYGQVSKPGPSLLNQVSHLHRNMASGNPHLFDKSLKSPINGFIMINQRSK